MNRLQVHVEIGGRTVSAGFTHFHRRGRSLATSFSDDPAYLTNPSAYSLDPSLPLFSGPHNTTGLPGAFADCAPDRWGRNLIAQRSRSQALATGRTPPSVDDIDFLVNVSDLTRQGALRFRVDDGAEFLSPETQLE